MRARLAKLIIRACARLPLTVNHGLGSAVGTLLGWIPNRSLRDSHTNIALCLPELDARARKRLVATSLRESGKALFEAGPVWHWSRKRLSNLVLSCEGQAEVDAALAEGRGLVMATPHLGCWEMAGQFCAMRWGITNLYRPPRLKQLDKLIRDGRQHLGAHLVPTDSSGVRALRRALKQGEMIGILPDQDAGTSGSTFAPFFGVEASTMMLLPRLAKANDAPVFLTSCLRAPGGRGFHMKFVRAPAGITDTDPLVATSALNQGVEALVRECPEQYQWSYRRFKTRPDGEPKLY